jgi:CubicO group peptidase (beta-lactamase class C family)
VFNPFNHCTALFSLAVWLTALLAPTFICYQTAAAAPSPRSGHLDPALKNLDDQFASQLKKFEIPGATFCLARNGRILLDRAYGWADVDEKIPVKPNSIFRIASLSKPLTALAVLKLIQDGKLSLDANAFALLPNLRPFNGKADKDLERITIRNLLNCSAGWNQEASGDYVFAPHAYEVAQYSVTLRPTAQATIALNMTTPLEFKPGSQFCYSNVSYMILGEIISKVSGQSYIEFVKQSILHPLGLTRILPGQTVAQQADEVRYYPAETPGNSLIPNVRGVVSPAYGSDFYLEAIMATAGWTANAQDLVKLGTAFNNGASKQQVLKPELVKQMFAVPPYLKDASDKEYFAMGWEVRRDKRGNISEFSRHGSLHGSMSLLSCRRDGIVWAALFNTRPSDYVPTREQIKSSIERALAADVSHIK